MTAQIDFTDEHCNTRYAPLAVLMAHYQQKQVLEPLKNVTFRQKTRDFHGVDKLCQVLLSIMCGCTTLYEVNSKLQSEIRLAHIWSHQRIADQSTLSRTLDELSLEQIDELRQAVTQILRQIGQTHRHNWHGHLWLDYDLSPLPCGKQAEAAQKGFFSGKKTSPGVNSLGSA
jgi:hypothetical protein